MGKNITISSADGFEFGAYRADPTGQPKGGVLVIQEIFGVNQHIREVCDAYARHGYVAIAPALYDRIDTDVQLGYDFDSMSTGIEYKVGLRMPLVLDDLQATVDVLSESGKVAVVGYCFGGTLAWLAANELQGIACVSAYYGGEIVSYLDRRPRCPIILHFGEQDKHIPMSDVDEIRENHPSITIYIYPADHGFNCAHRAQYHEPSAQLSLERTLALLSKYLDT